MKVWSDRWNGRIAIIAIFAVSITLTGFKCPSDKSVTIAAGADGSGSTAGNVSGTAHGLPDSAETLRADLKKAGKSEERIQEGLRTTMTKTKMASLFKDAVKPYCRGANPLLIFSFRAEKERVGLTKLYDGAPARPDYAEAQMLRALRTCAKTDGTKFSTILKQFKASADANGGPDGKLAAVIVSDGGLDPDDEQATVAAAKELATSGRFIALLVLPVQEDQRQRDETVLASLAERGKLFVAGSFDSQDAIKRFHSKIGSN